MVWRLGVSQGGGLGCIISTPQQSSDSGSVNGKINHMVSGEKEEGDFQCGGDRAVWKTTAPCQRLVELERRCREQERRLGNEKRGIT